MITIYDYLDYREYLKDILSYKKRENKAFSHRMILSKMGVASSGFLSNVIARKCHFTAENVERISLILKLSPIETHYFHLLLYFSKAKSVSEKNDFYNQIIEFRKRKHKRLKNKELTLLSKWYYPAIRELILFSDFDDDYSQLAKEIEPALREYEAKSAIKTLTRLGFIEKQKNGNYIQKEPGLTTGDEIKSLHAVNFQLEMMELAKRAITKIPSEERDISCVTLSVSKRKFKLIKQEHQKFRKKIMQIAIDDENKPEQIIQCNMQLFPLSKGR